MRNETINNQTRVCSVISGIRSTIHSLNNWRLSKTIQSSFKSNLYKENSLNHAASIGIQHIHSVQDGLLLAIGVELYFRGRISGHTQLSLRQLEVLDQYYQGSPGALFPATFAKDFDREVRPVGRWVVIPNTISSLNFFNPVFAHFNLRGLSTV